MYPVDVANYHKGKVQVAQRVFLDHSTKLKMGDQPGSGLSPILMSLPSSPTFNFILVNDIAFLCTETHIKSKGSFLNIRHAKSGGLSGDLERISCDCPSRLADMGRHVVTRAVHQPVHAAFNRHRANREVGSLLVALSQGETRRCGEDGVWPGYYMAVIKSFRTLKSTGFVRW